MLKVNYTHAITRWFIDEGLQDTERRCTVLGRYSFPSAYWEIFISINLVRKAFPIYTGYKLDIKVQQKFNFKRLTLVKPISVKCSQNFSKSFFLIISSPVQVSQASFRHKLQKVSSAKLSQNYSKWSLEKLWVINVMLWYALVFEIVSNGASLMQHQWNG